VLSDLLNSYAAHFAKWAQAGGTQMDARVCALMRTNLADAADQARRLERHGVPVSDRPLPPGVVNLDFERTARLVAGLPSGGSAA
jgi:hypothetical protein